MFFQNTIIKRHIALLNDEQVKAAWEQYKALFLNQIRQDNIHASKEEQFQEGFLRDLFVKTLGYTINPDPDFNLITEKKNEKDSKKADGAIQRDGKVIGIIELKDHKTPNLTQVETQAFGYKNQHRGTRYVIISNFEKLRFYIDDATEFKEWDLFSLKEEDFRELYFCLSWKTLSQDLPIKAKTESVSDEDQITQKLYRDYSAFKREMFADILKNNTTEDTPKEHILLLFKKTQKLLDRLLFIFFAEDCDLLPPNMMLQIINEWEHLKDMDVEIPLYKRIRQYFGYLDTGNEKRNIFAYNGGLFKPDEVLDALIISDELLALHTKKLSEYDYASEVDVNILGHIFENSLSEIEEVTAQINAGSPSLQGRSGEASKRKRDGVFYTPQYITKYIVENTVGKLCAEKKAELGIDESEYFADKNRKMATKKHLVDNLTAYRNWLLEISICDPACGSGAFLNAALQFLMAEHKLIDEMEAKVTESPMPMPYIRNVILEKNLFGVDINEESVEIAKLALWLRTAEPNRKLSSLNNNIKCGNSLISDPEIAGEKAFNWQAEFPQVFAKGGFDIVIGNPPYVLCQPSNTAEDVLNYYKQFKVASYKIDLFHLFFERGISILKDKGRMGYITPNTYLTNKYIHPLRRFILDNTSVKAIVNHDEKVFVDASVDVATIILHKDKSYQNKVDIIQSDLHNNFVLQEQKNQSEWEQDDDCVFNIKKAFELSLQNCVSLGEVCSSYFGIQAFDRKSSINNEKLNEHYIPIIDGEDIFPYNYSVPTKYFNYLPENIKSGGDWNIYAKERIVIRQIGITPVVGLCEGEILSSNTMYSVYPTNPEWNLKYILCLLNSKLIKAYWLAKYSDSKLLFPKIKGYQIKDLPLHKCADQQPFIDLADRMLSLNKDLQAKRARFLQLLQNNLPEVKISGSLADFDTLDFTGFVAELKKQKIKLSLKQQDEWMDFFTKYKSACNDLSAQIAATDRDIDTRVYALYGITEDEIKLIEQ